MSTRESTTVQAAPAPVVALLEGLFDYAGLFPPSGLGMQQAALNYHNYRHSEHAWMLGRFVVPSGRLTELSAAVETLGEAAENVQHAWPLSVLSKDWQQDALLIEQFQQQYPDRFQVVAIETRQLQRPATSGLEFYVELNWAAPVREQLEQLTAGDAAKLRAGGLDSDQFPPTESVVEFMSQCQAKGAPFKATAGLHHALPARRPTCDQEDAPIADMHGFINLGLAATLCQSGGEPALIRALLEEKDISAFQCGNDQIVWRTESFSTKSIRQARRDLFRSIGSCSFETPLTELRVARWLT